ncbi:MAG: hypothetical protein Q9195_002116 [Heterodermia aff. obscurata]
MSLQNALKALHAAGPPENATAAPASITNLPANILEAFIPGYSVISGFLFDLLGFDITLVVSVSLLLFGLFTSIKFLWRHASDQFQAYFTSFINIESHDDIYDHLMDWLAAHDVVKYSRSLMAESSHQNAWDAEHSETEDEDAETTELLNFRNWDAKTPPKFIPYFGIHRFWHKGRYFKFSRQNKQMMYQGWGGTVFQNDETITLSCIGRSTKPIKDLIEEARGIYLKKGKASTAVKRPAPKDQRSRGRVWNKVASRPSRPMNTVILDHSQKDRILLDINEYLHPATPRWYANRGIPYRRGYLFAGPPGTGKSSLAWAISGIFGLDIFCISLVEPSLTEEDLGLLFTSLPRRCVVLLEDIDSAGLVKRQEPGPTVAKPEEQDAAAKIGAEITKALSSAQQNNKGNKDHQGISLSGLLNAIDGVASHEGRVLVMTSNFPDKLDDALIRPGRIDMRIDFTNATRSQTIELFTNMYLPDTPTMKTVLTAGTANIVPSSATLRSPGLAQRMSSKCAPSDKNANTSLKAAAALTPPLTPRDNEFTNAASTIPSIETSDSSFSLRANGDLEPLKSPVSILAAEELKQIAKDFADRIPEETFSPAEIQGFLLTRKKEPLRALEEVESWKVETLKAKEKKKEAEVSLSDAAPPSPQSPSAEMEAPEESKAEDSESEDSETEHHAFVYMGSEDSESEGSEPEDSDSEASDPSGSEPDDCESEDCVSEDSF